MRRPVWFDRLLGRQVNRLLVDDDAVDALTAAYGTDEVVTCDDCQGVLDQDNVAVTCPDHMLCTDCDASANPCGECRAARRLESADEIYDWAREGWVR